MFPRRQASDTVPIPESAMSPGARAALAYAADEARALHQNYLGTEHILLGLMREPSSNATRILTSHAELGSVRALIRETGGTHRSVSGDESTLTPRAARVLHYARREADQYHEDLVSPDHLLLGIVREGEGNATQVLLRLGIELGTLREEVARSWGGNGG
jgi:ATP-dependent Clp protease ATP-binding subunit ClpC